ncbi:tyrosine-type recombinase/integrase [Jeotgalibaca porci]|uniref:tyrosine-type recombinase/integrase n=1 Tax=Jeotgalibaca porci TaxID=1868793 RepID=UPI0035A00D9F
MKKEKIKKYTLKSGESRYMFQIYLGINPLTGKEARTTRRGFKTKKEAEIGLARLLLEYDENKGLKDKKKKMTFKEATESWLAVYKQTRIKQNTYENSVFKFEQHILPKFGHLLLANITPDYCQKVVLNWAEYYQEFSNLISLTSRVFDYARLTLKVIDDNPIKDIIRPVTKDKTPYESPHYDREQLAHFLSCADQIDAQTSILFRLLAYTGCRKGEILGLQWRDYDEISNSIRIERTAAYTKAGKVSLHAPKTQSGVRTISLDEETGKRLREWKTTQRKELLMRGYSARSTTQHIVTNKKNGIMHLSSPNYLLIKIEKKYDIDHISIHGFRHTHTTLLIEAGVPFKEIQDRLGWGNPDMLLKIYSHVNKKDKLNTGNKFAEYIN